jgi:hypothetical protein
MASIENKTPERTSDPKDRRFLTADDAPHPDWLEKIRKSFVFIVHVFTRA